MRPETCVAALTKGSFLNRIHCEDTKLRHGAVQIKRTKQKTSWYKRTTTEMQRKVSEA